MFTEAETQLLYQEQKKKLERCGSVCDDSDLAYEKLCSPTYRTSLSRLRSCVNGTMDTIQEMEKGYTIPGPSPWLSKKMH